jgi:hypothetical protein
VNYILAKESLIKLFEDNNFADNINNNNRHATSIIIEICSSNSEISISFPGYKAYISDDKIIYDYRVDLNKNGKTYSLSHSNIIIDIYNKITFGGMSANNLRSVLIAVAQEGNSDLIEIEKILPYSPVIPSEDLLNYAHAAHNDKYYNKTANSTDLTIKELFLSIKWIVLQEDINYPISSGFEGRKMPFSRYLETVFITQNNNHKFLKSVIQRALSHTRPRKWPAMDYSFTNNIK